MHQEQQPRGNGNVAATAPGKGQVGGAKGKNKSKGKGKAEGRGRGKAESTGTGKGEGPWPQTAQVDALQGLWEEVGRSNKQWLIKGHAATEVTSGGQMGRKFTVREDADGNVQWGTNGKYFLDRRFGFSMETAVWRLGSPDGTEAFSWRFVKMPSSGGQTGCSAGHAPIEGHLGPSSPGQLCTDPADAAAYTQQETRTHYAAESTQRESEVCWEACKVIKPPVDVQVERRIDPDDGNIYTWEEVAALYGSEFSLQDIRDYWDHCKVVSWTMPKRRIDPADGMPYSWREMKAHYANDYTLSATVAYWDACKEEEDYSHSVGAGPPS